MGPDLPWYDAGMVSLDQGPDRFDYDALETRVFVWDSYSQLAVLRSLEVEWSWFNTDPAYAVTEVLGLVSLEDFMGGDVFVGVPAAVVEEARAYVLGVRVPGSSTLVEVRLPDGGAWELRIDGAACEHPGGPGPSYAGVVDARVRAGSSRVVRRLVAPGLRTIRLSGSVVGAGKAERVVSIERMLARGSIARLEASFDSAEQAVRLRTHDVAAREG